MVLSDAYVLLNLSFKTVLIAEVSTAKQRNDRDQSRIVQSPDRLRRTIAKLIADVEAERAAAEQNRSKARDYQAKLTQLDHIQQVRGADSYLNMINAKTRLTGPPDS